MEIFKFMFYTFILIPICISFIIAIFFYFTVFCFSLKKYGFKYTVTQIFNDVKRELGIY